MQLYFQHATPLSLTQNNCHFVFGDWKSQNVYITATGIGISAPWCIEQVKHVAAAWCTTSYMGQKCDLSDCGRITGAWQAGLSISDKADFRNNSLKCINRMACKTNKKKIQWAMDPVWSFTSDLTHQHGISIRQTAPCRIYFLPMKVQGAGVCSN